MAEPEHRSTTLDAGGQTDAARRTAFNIGQSSPANTFLPIWMAAAGGLYDSHGLDARIVPMVGGRELGPALQSGRIQVMHIGMSSVLRASHAGARLKIVASLSNVIRFTLFAAPGIRTAADLHGGTIGISSIGSESDATITLALRKLGMERRDIIIKEIGLNRLEALRNGEIAATALNEPERSRAFALGLAPLVDLCADKTPWVFTGLVVDEAYLRANRHTVLRFLQATLEGHYLALAEPLRAKQVLARALTLVDPRLIDVNYEDYKSATPADLEISEAAAENVFATMSSLTAGRRLDDYIDLSLVQDLRAGGTLAALRRKYSG